MGDFYFIRCLLRGDVAGGGAATGPPSTSLQKLAYRTSARRPRASGDPEPAPGMNRGRALLRQLVVKIMPLPIVALNQLKFPRAAPFLDPLFAEDRIGDGLVKLDKH